MLAVCTRYGSLSQGMLPSPRARSCLCSDTHIFVRVQARILLPVQLSVLLSILLLELIPAVEGQCMAVVHSQLGNVPLQLSLSVAAAVLGIL